jgi:hypothetical protein
MTLNEIITKYAGQKHVRGSVDCNLMVLELHDPDVYEVMANEYTDLANGVQRSKSKLGVVSMRQFLKKNPNYIRISPDQQKQGDIVVFHKGFNCYLSLEDKWFGVNQEDHFGFMPVCDHNDSNYLVFRRSK